VDGGSTVDAITYTNSSDFPTTGVSLNANGFSYEMVGSQGKIFRSAGNTKALMEINDNNDLHLYDDTGTTAKFVWDSSAESLGIGTASPSQKLTVTGNAYVGTGNYFTDNTSGYFFSGNGSYDAGLYATGTSLTTLKAQNNLSFVTNGTERMRIGSAGDVGIKQANDTNAYLTLDGVTNSYFNMDSANGYILSGSNTIFNTNGTERARIDSSGNFGIGTSNPNYKLVVSDSSGAGLEFIPETSNNRVTLLSYDRASNAHRQINFDCSETLFRISGSEKVRVATNGNLLVGTDNSPSITQSLSVAGRMFSVGTYANNSAAGANLGISSSGEIYRSTSSLRYKTDVQDAQHGLTEVMALRPVTYRGINDGDTVFGGLIAEEVHDAGLTEFVEYNEDNEPDALAYANMVSLCIKAIQDQQEIIESLKTRIETLENTGA